jgi:hypothetical protein
MSVVALVIAPSIAMKKVDMKKEESKLLNMPKKEIVLKK